MKNNLKGLRIIAVVAIILMIFQASYAQTSIVERYGLLSAKGNRILGENGDTVQLRGMSFFWSQWMPQFYNESCVKWLKEDWKCTVVRPAMGVEKGGYLTNPDEEKETIMKVVDAAISNGIYVVIDYHSHEAHKDAESAIAFFSEMAEKYGKHKNVIYEIYNEPLADPNWSKDLKPYGEQVISAIRKYDPDNLVIMGTRQWSQKASEAAKDPIKDVNLAYALHFYPHTHRQWLMDEAKAAMDQGIALFASEMGTCDASGNNFFNPKETQKWFDFLDKHKISWCNWSVCDKDETASALKPGASPLGNWKDDELTESGKLIKAELVLKNTPIWNATKNSKRKNKK